MTIPEIIVGKSQLRSPLFWIGMIAAIITAVGAILVSYSNAKVVDHINIGIDTSVNKCRVAEGCSYSGMSSVTP